MKFLLIRELCVFERNWEHHWWNLFYETRKLWLWCNIEFDIWFSGLYDFESDTMVRDKEIRKFIERKPCHIIDEIWFENFWNIFIVTDIRKIKKLCPTHCTSHNKRFRNDILYSKMYPNFLSSLANCTLTKELIIFEFSSWKCPMKRPCIGIFWAFDKEYMWTVFTYDICCCGDESSRHRKVNKRVLIVQNCWDYTVEC